MRSEKLFRKIKRVISQFIETEYWYRFRQLPSFWYDDKQNIYSPLNEKIPARDWLTRTWDGENDILDIMRLKIEHMFWNYSFSEECHETRNWKSQLWIGNTYTQEYDREDSSSVIEI